MEYMQGGSLTDAIERNLEKITEQRMAHIVKATLSGLAHLHIKAIIHRDIKSDNVLLGKDGDVKLSVSKIFIHAREFSFFCFPAAKEPSQARQGRISRTRLKTALLSIP